MEKTLAAERTYILPSDSAGVAISSSPMELVARCRNSRPAAITSISPSSLDFLRGFADEYRGDTDSRTEARRLIKLIVRNQVERLIRQGSIKAKKIKGETRVSVGSVEDYLMELEAPDDAA